jgi:hypothetical protein
MPGLWEMVCDVEVLLGLQPEERGRCLSVVIDERQRQSGTVCIPNYLGEFFYREPYPAGRQREVEGAILEAPPGSARPAYCHTHAELRRTARRRARGRVFCALWIPRMPPRSRA